MWRTAIILAVLAVGRRSAHADDADKAGELFDRARELVKAEKPREACPLFEESLRLAPALGTELNLARCYAATGRLVTARDMFEALIPKTVTAAQPQREAIAREGLADVSRRIPWIKLELVGVTTTVRIDNAVVADPNAPIAVDPGFHRVEAEGAATQTVNALEGEVTKVRLTMDSGVGTRFKRFVSTIPLNAWIVGGTGAACLVGGTVAGILVITRRSDGFERCEYDPAGKLICDPRGAELLADARSLGHVSTGLFVTGLALSAGATALTIKARRSRVAVSGTWVARTAPGIAMEVRW